MLKTELIRKVKKITLAPIYKAVRKAEDGPIRINDFWDDKKETRNPKLSKIWKTRAYFLQDFKRFIPDDIKVIMAQKSGTFAIKRTGDTNDL